MRSPFQSHWLLRSMNRGLCRSDPHLAAMFAIFARLNACEAVASLEQVASPGVRAWRGLVRLMRVTARMTAALVVRAARAADSPAYTVSAGHASRAVPENHGQES